MSAPTRKSLTRYIDLMHGQESTSASNRFTTTLFTPITLLPKSLFHQFRRVSNLWFLAIASVDFFLFRGQSDSAWAAAVPIVAMLLGAVVKDAVCDFKRYKRDKEVNDQFAEVWGGEEFGKVAWKDVKVGAYVLLRNDSIAPADLLLFATGPSNSPCYFDISAITAERALQQKVPVKEIAQKVQTASEIEAAKVITHLSGTIKLGEPSAEFDIIESTVKLSRSPKAEAVTIAKFILRGSVLRSTLWAIGIVVYAGNDTKVGLWTKRRKRLGRVKNIANIWMAGIVVIVVIASFAFALCSAFGPKDAEASFAEMLVSFIILLSSAVPISLMLALDIVQSLQARGIAQQTNNSVRVLSSAVLDSLPLVEYLFLDQSSLVEIRPVIHSFVIGDREFSYAAICENSVKDESWQLKGDGSNDEEVSSLRASEPTMRTNLSFFRGKTAIAIEAIVGLMCEGLALMNGDETAQSEVEECIANGLKGIGCIAESIHPSQTLVLHGSKSTLFDVIGCSNQSPFGKCRKIVVQKQGETDGRYYVKGSFAAVSHVLDLTAEEREELDTKIRSMEVEGLAAILVGFAEILEEKFEVIRESSADMCDSIESSESIKLLGIVTLSMPALQEVKTSVELLQSAGVKLWYTHIDTEQSALAAVQNIGLLRSDSQVVTLKGKRSEEVIQRELIHWIRVCIQHTESRGLDAARADEQTEEVVNARLHDLKRIDGLNFSETITALSCDPKQVNFSVVIEGDTLEAIIGSVECRRLLSYLLFCANSVVCFAVKNSGKRALAEIVTESFSFRPVTAAIAAAYSGLPLLQTATVRLCISSSAVLQSTSDLAISSLSALPDVLFRHGRKCSECVSSTVVFYVFNSVLQATALLWFCIISEFTGTYLLDPGEVVAGNAVFMGLPVVVLGLINDWEKEEVDGISLANMRKRLLKTPLLRVSTLLKTVVCAFFQCGVLIVLMFQSLRPIRPDGKTEQFAATSVLLSIAIVLTGNYHTAVYAHRRNWGFVLSVAASTGAMCCYLGVSGNYVTRDLFGGFTPVWTSPHWLCSVLISPLACCAVSLLFRLIPLLYSQSQSHNLIATQDLSPTDPRFRLHQYCEDLQKVYHTHTLSSSEQSNTIHPFTLRFTSQYFESQYQAAYLTSHLPMFRGLMVFVWFLTVCWVVVDALIMNPSMSFILYRVALSMLFFLLFLLTLTKWFRDHYITAILIIIFAGLVSKIAAELMYSIVGGMAAAMIPMASYIFINVDIVWVTILNVGNILFFTISGAVVEANQDPVETAVKILGYEIVLASLTIIAGNAGYILEKADRIEYQIKTSTAKAAEKSRSILSLLLPPFVISKVLDLTAGSYISENQGNVTVVFCDFCDFEAICSVYRPQELTTLLDEIFRQFDDLCQSNGVVKIETVGKTYMACAGLKYVDSDLSPTIKCISHPRRAIEFALDLIEVTGKYALKTGKLLEVKIGINSGPVITGVVGYHKPQFSLVGDTVNTASRMCSTLKTSNCVQISKQSFDMLEEQQGLSFEEKIVYAKGKGDMQTFLVKRDGEKLREIVLGKSFIMRLSEMQMFMSSERSSLLFSRYPGSKCCPSVSCTETAEEKVFRLSVYPQTRQIAIRTLSSTTLIQLLLFILRCIQYEFLPHLATWEVLVSYGILTFFPLVCLAVPRNLQLNRLFSKVQIFLYIGAIWLVLVDFIAGTDYEAELIAIEVMNVFLLSTWAGLHFFKESMALAGAVGLSWLAMVFYAKDYGKHLIEFLFIIVYAGINNYALFSRERHLRHYTRLKEVETQELEKNERLLQQMVPKSVYAKLQQDLPVTDKLHNVTVLFADIVGFTNWSADKKPEEVVGMLSALFTQFDLLCVKLKIYKVHTIGDCYVVMGFDGEEDNFDADAGCARVLCMGHEMLRTIHSVNAREGISLNMRIGIHTGDVIAGITGNDVIRYDIYGPDVMLANKAESGGAAGKVNVTEATRSVLERTAPALVQYTPNSQITTQSEEVSLATFFAEVDDLEALLRAGSPFR